MAGQGGVCGPLGVTAAGDVAGCLLIGLTASLVSPADFVSSAMQAR